MMTKLLSPVGDMESLKCAVLYGADSVYLGGSAFGMRAGYGGRRGGFDGDTLTEAVTFAHSHGVKVSLTVNTVPTNEDIDEYPAFIENAAACGIDAAIVSDIGVLALTKQHAPDLAIHMSTQVGIMNYAAANALYDLGARLVVLARELSLQDIKVLREKTKPQLDLEVFVHGAMCVSFSGRCLLSQYTDSRDANRGLCAQPCRRAYNVSESERGLYLYEENGGSFILNANDMCMLTHLRDLIDAGANALKIEGRAKSSYYVAAVTNAYRAALDSARRNEPPPDWTIAEANAVSHRPYSTGFYFGRPGQNLDYGGYLREREVVAMVTGYDSNRGLIEVKQRNLFILSQTIDIISPKTSPREQKFSVLLDKDLSQTDRANKAGETYYLEGERLPDYTFIRTFS